jgi:raffinose/stachyose/melibiose transport system permease protein
MVLVLPIIYLAGLSVTPGDQLGQEILGILPPAIRLQNYPDAFDLFARYVVAIPTLMMNSAIVTSSAIILCLCIAILASYAFATMRFPGRRTLFYILLLGLTVPIPVMLIPEFMVVLTYGLIGTYFSLILPYVVFGLPLPILILSTFFRLIPSELVDAARIDGASRGRILWSIFLPVSRPAIAAAVIFLALQFWNEFALALVIIQDPNLTTVPLGLASVLGKGVNPWQLITAAMMVTSIPVVALFVLLQRQLIEGLGRGWVQG